ncbi:MAG: class I SAM-dependent methyltransferase [Candidatus Gracilibacteria bacterium]
MKDKTARELLEKVKLDYALISEDFAKTREDVWPEFERFKRYIKKTDAIADVGCGSGRLLKILGENVNYTGIDNNESLLAEAKKRFGDNKFILGDMLEIPLNSSSQNIVFSIAAMHHIPSKGLRKKAFREIHRILKPGGILIIMVWDLFQRKHILKILKSLFDTKYDYKDIFIKWGNTGVKRYYHAFTPGEIKCLLNETGFGIIETTYTKNICIIARKIGVKESIF